MKLLIGQCLVFMLGGALGGFAVSNTTGGDVSSTSDSSRVQSPEGTHALAMQDDVFRTAACAVRTGSCAQPEADHAVLHRFETGSALVVRQAIKTLPDVSAARILRDHTQLPLFIDHFSSEPPAADTGARGWRTITEFSPVFASESLEVTSVSQKEIASLLTGARKLPDSTQSVKVYAHGGVLQRRSLDDLARRVGVAEVSNSAITWVDGYEELATVSREAPNAIVFGLKRVRAPGLRLLRVDGVALIDRGPKGELTFSPKYPLKTWVRLSGGRDPMHAYERTASIVGTARDVLLHTGD